MSSKENIDIPEEDDLYKILGVTTTASSYEIRKAYFALARKYHPDHNQNDANANQKFQRIGKAYTILSDPTKRKRYDRTGNIDDSFENLEDVDWKEYFESLFKRVTEEDIENFAQKYRHSKEEEEDLKKAYNEYKGDMVKILESIMLATDEDYDRFYEYLKKCIETGELKKYPAFKKETKKAKKKRLKQAQQEQKEFEELKQLINKKKGKNSLMKAQKSFEELTAKIKAKYSESNEELENEPTEEEFQKARERLNKRRKQYESENKASKKRKKDDNDRPKKRRKTKK